MVVPPNHPFTDGCSILNYWEIMQTHGNPHMCPGTAEQHRQHQLVVSI